MSVFQSALVFLALIAMIVFLAYKRLATLQFWNELTRLARRYDKPDPFDEHF